MATFIIYIIRWGVVLTMLYSLYGLFMKRETLHGVNRVVLLLILTASMVLPLVQVETTEPNLVIKGREYIEQGIKLQTPPLAPSSFERRGMATVWSDANDGPVPLLPSTRGGVGAYILLALVLIYVTGAAVAWLCYLWSLGALIVLIRQGQRVDIDGLPQGVGVLTHPAVTTPCSWMRWALLPATDLQSRPIVEHELAHIRFGHSWDMLLCELTCRMLWPVPFAWMLRQDLRDVHEYQADRAVLQSGINDEEYQLLLIRKATGARLQPVVNALNQSPVKRRFQMMYAKPSRRWMALKAAYLVPLSLLTVMAFAQPQAISRIEREVVQAVRFADERLVQADLRSNPNADFATVSSSAANSGAAIPLPAGAGTVTILDSVMTAIGARKVADGTYVGHFQPSLSGDTVCLRQVVFLDQRSRQVAELTFPQHADATEACYMALQSATRRDERGFYIRQLRPVKATAFQYDKPNYPQQ